MLNTINVAEASEFMDSIPSNFVDYTLTSPPYDKQRIYNGFSFDFETIAKHLYRITKVGGVLTWVVSDQVIDGSETGSAFKQVLFFMSLGFKLHDTMIYGKLNFIPQSHKRYEQAFEFMFVFVKGKIKTFNSIMVISKTAGTNQFLARKGYGFKEGSFRRREENVIVKPLKIPGNIFYYACGASGKNHPAVFPAKLAKDQILTWSNPLDVVFDCFSGSGTTAEEAKKLGRYFIACDISEEYVKDSIVRIDKIEDQTYMLS